MPLCVCLRVRCLGSDVAMAHVFATEDERKEFCANTVRAARQSLSKARRIAQRRVAN